MTSSSSLRLGTLGLEHGNSGGDKTVTNTRNNSTGNELTKRVRSTLQNGTNSHDDRAPENHTSSTEFVSGPHGEQSADHTSNLVNTDRHTLDGGVELSGLLRNVVGGVHLGELVDEPGRVSRPPMTPWSYPNSRKPIPAMKATARWSFWPRRPRNSVLTSVEACENASQFRPMLKLY